MYYPTEGRLWVSVVTQNEKGKYNHKILQARDFQHSKGNFVHLYIDQTYLGVTLLIYI